MAADGQAGEDRHQSQHRAWVESLPKGAAAALTDSQLERWPPAPQWTRLTAQCVDLSKASKQVAAAIAQRMYPHPDTDLCRNRRRPPKWQIAADTGRSQGNVAEVMDHLEEHGWLRQIGGRRGRAARLMLTVPELIRVDGVLEEHGERSEGRVRYAEPLSSPERFDREPLSSPERFDREPLSSPERFDPVETSEDDGHAEPLSSPERLHDGATDARNGETSLLTGEEPLSSPESTAGAEGKANPLPTEPVQKMSTEGVSTNGLPASWSRSRELVECVAGDGLTLVRDEHGRARHPSCAGFVYEFVEPGEVGS